MWSPGPIPHTVFGEPCLDFINSLFADYRDGRAQFDRLDLPEWREWFVKRWDLPTPATVSPATLHRLKQVRADLRSGFEPRDRLNRSRLARLNTLLAASPQVWRLELRSLRRADRRMAPGLHPLKRGWDAAIGRIVLSYAELVSSGEVGRVKHCQNPNCSFLFFDDSVNRTRRWCDPRLCGNLMRVRQFRARRH
jgi:predicted RNA-binding Zn ribbon-like protein